MFALRRSLPALEGAIDQTPQKVASDVVLAEQTLLLVPPEAFTTLEWKELAVTVRERLDRILITLQERHGEAIIRELAELREAVRAVAADQRAEAFRTKRDFEAAVKRRETREANHSLMIVAVIAAAGILFCVFCFVANR